MRPEDVYVVYDQGEDTIVSVHSIREFATMERDRIITVFTQAGRPAPFMRFAVTNLKEAIEWMYAPDTENQEYFRIDKKIEVN